MIRIGRFNNRPERAQPCHGCEAVRTAIRRLVTRVTRQPVAANAEKDRGVKDVR